jgi:hypothetical protein
VNESAQSAPDDEQPNAINEAGSYKGNDKKRKRISILFREARKCLPAGKRRLKTYS